MKLLTSFPSLEEHLFYKALRIRLVEEKIIELYPSDKIQSPVHLSIGQEAVAVGSCHDLKPTDLLFGSYRSHAFYLAKGGDMREMFAELYGKATGCGKGKAGSMHLTAPKVGMTVASAVVASTIPHAVGAALAAKRLKKKQWIIAAFGDGATEEGVFHESLNLASLYKVPVVFLCENNGLAVHASLSARQSYRILDLVKSYGIETDECKEGYDLMKVYESFSRVLGRVQEKGLPQFIEIKTYRYREHVGPGEDHHVGYRSPEELKAWQAKDPLILRQDWVEKYRPMILEEIEDAVQFAENSPWPSSEELLTDVR